MEKNKATLIKVFPIKRKINENKIFDSILIFYRDENGIKKTRFVERAESPYYILKDKTSKEAVSQPIFIEEDKVEKISVYSDCIFRDIAQRTNSLGYFDRVVMRNGMNSSNMKNLFKHPYIYDADMDISDRYIRNFHDEFDVNPAYKLHKGFFDIEVDIEGYNGFPDEEIAPCPINIITFIDGKELASYSFVVRNEKNESLKEFERDIESFKKELLQEIEIEDKVSLSNLSIEFFDTELEAIASFFKKVHEVDPDFMLAWNEAFDVLTMQNRLRKLFEQKKLRDPSLKDISAYDLMLSVICDKKYFLQKDSLGNSVYLSPKAKYISQKDKSFVDRMDSFMVLDGIQWLDQMLVFANIRKTSGQRESYTLDAIANEEIGREKLPFGPGETIKNLPWKNFKKFAKYNIRDVLLLYLLENKNLDVNSLQSISEITSTRTEKVLKKTISLKNFVNKFANMNGFIMNNNKNAKYGDDYDYFNEFFSNKEKIKETNEDYKFLFDKKENFGAYVGDPNNNTNKNGIEIVPGKKNGFIFENVFDMDFSSLYPSIIQAFNLSPASQVGKFFLIDSKIKGKLKDEYGFGDLFMESENNKKPTEIPDEKTDLGPILSDFIQSQDFSKIGSVFFDLPDTEEMVKKIRERKNL